ncbi:SixA phosphatase family protein [Sphingobium sp. CR28]|uniref:SixA phosphatase family protein n=1 Tax=Sphingobium sp. CR28 TaxID=3400272 RepID=UPI003FED82BB
MKRLILLRHAKSDWSDGAMRDFDRPLNSRGERAARLMGRWAAQQALSCDMVVASPAVRVRETLDHFRVAFPVCPGPHWERRLYLATAATLLEIVHEFPQQIDTVMLVGHNPGLEDLILDLVADDGLSTMRHSVEEKFPTASIAALDCDVLDWHDVGTGARFRYFVRPRDLDVALGPQER